MTLPRKSTLFPNVQRDTDARGEILSIVDQTVQNVSIITSNPGSIRSNHWHHSDFHLMYILEGEIDYFYKDVDDGEIKYIKVRTGDNIFTPDNELHATYFPVKTVMVVSSKFPRDQETYERDTVREQLITQDNIQEMLAKYA
ncbi:cupin domain-containing protein [Brevundimonas sp.]|uniref:polysaccharide biosynthesis C-terminal domain-containing protein n=1 Tax=Brevundimonas sp. TaxID=1871086 RepID=UPI002737E074|nr:cupin domain-containing protein [Brevundimonas sp.]MDP3802978.1 cupin domain-containing protein [Brevundimonas sp.]